MNTRVASAPATAVLAAYAALVGLLAKAAVLGAEGATALASLSRGSSLTRGIVVGQQMADQIMALRST